MSEEHNIDTLKIIVKGAGIVLTGLLVSKLFSYLFRIFIARHYGPGDYGLFTLGIAVLGLFMTFAILGIHTGVVRYTAYHRGKNKSDSEKHVKGVITSSIKIVLISSIITTFILAISSQYISEIFNEPDLANILLILSVSIPFSALFLVFISVFVGFKEIKYKIYSESIFLNAIKLVIVIILAAFGFDVLGIAWTWTIASVLALFVSLYYLKKVFPAITKKIASIEMKKEMFTYSLPLLLASTMNFIIMWIDTIMLGYFKTVTDVGIYNAAMPTAQILLILPNAIIALFFPIITELFAKKKRSELQSLYKTVNRWILYINLPIYLMLVFFSSQILGLLFGPEYMGGYTALIILSTGLMFRKVAQGQMVRLIEMLEKTKIILYVSIVATVSDILLNYILIPIYGLTGAALATMITYILTFGLYYALSYRLTKFSPFSKNMLKSVVAGIASILIVHTIAINLFTAFPIHVMIILFAGLIGLYFMILLVLRSFSSEDIELMKSIEQKSGLKLNFLKNILKRFV